MKIYRYMSKKEFCKLTAGIELINKSSHGNKRTNSNGFCFLGEVTNIGEYELNPIECYEFLAGIVSSEILVEFETKTKLDETFGVYCNPFTYQCDVITEYCIVKYDNEILKPVRYAIVGDWKWYNIN